MRKTVALILAFVMCLSMRAIPAAAMDLDSLMQSILDGEDVDIDALIEQMTEGLGDIDQNIENNQNIPNTPQDEPAPPNLADSGPGAAPLTATPTASTVLVNGQRVSFDAYLIEGNNYFKLRDLAFTLNGTEKQFAVGWDGANDAISLTKGQPYAPVGGEMAGKGGGVKSAEPTSSKIIKDGMAASFTAYLIDGNNYFKLRDIGASFDFGVDWDGAANTIAIDTSKGYTPDRSAVLAIAKKYHDLAEPKIEVMLRPVYKQAVAWTPDFTAADPQGLDYGTLFDAGVAVKQGDSPYFALSYATAIYARDPANPFSAGIMGTAISLYGAEGSFVNDKKRAAYEDALVAHQFALQASMLEGYLTPSSLPHLQNIGELYMELGRAKEAVNSFETALAYDKTYRSARFALIDYYLYVRNYSAASKLIAEGAESASVVDKSRQKAAQEQTVVDEVTPKISNPDSASFDELEKAMDALTSIPETSMADFAETLAPEVAAQMRKKLYEVQEKMTIDIPDSKLLLQYSKFESFGEPLMLGAIAEYVARTEQFEKSTEKILSYNDLPDDIAGIVSGTVDPNRFAADKAAQMSQAMQSGDFSGLASAIQGTTPEIAIMLANPMDYDKPMDVMLQQANMKALLPKLQAFEAYYMKHIKELKNVLEDALNIYTVNDVRITEQFDQALERLKDDPNSTEEQKHNIHIQYYAQYNTYGSMFFQSASQAAAKAEKGVLKYGALMYKDCMKHIMLISDARVRERIENRLQRALVGAVLGIRSAVITAYADNYYDIRLCGCDLAAIEEERERLRKEFQDAQWEGAQRGQQAKMDFLTEKFDENGSFYKQRVGGSESKVNMVLFSWTINDVSSSFDADTSNLGPLAVALPFSGKLSHRENFRTGASSASGEMSIKLTEAASAGVNSSFSIDPATGKINVSTGTQAELGPAKIANRWTWDGQNIDRDTSIGLTSDKLKLIGIDAKFAAELGMTVRMGPDGKLCLHDARGDFSTGVNFKGASAKAEIATSVVKGTSASVSGSVGLGEFIPDSNLKVLADNLEKLRKRDINAEIGELTVWTGEYKFSN